MIAQHIVLVNSEGIQAQIYAFTHIFQLVLYEGSTMSSNLTRPVNFSYQD